MHRWITLRSASIIPVTPSPRHPVGTFGSGHQRRLIATEPAENHLLAFMTFSRAHRAQIYLTNPLERLNAEIKRRTNVVGNFPNDAFIVMLVDAMILEQNDEVSLNRRYMQQLEGLQTLSDPFPTRPSAVAR